MSCLLNSVRQIFAGIRMVVAIMFYSDDRRVPGVLYRVCSLFGGVWLTAIVSARSAMAATDVVVPLPVVGIVGVVVIVATLAVVGTVTRHLLAVQRLQEAERQHLQIARQLSTAQSIAHIGSWDQTLVNDRINWSAETYRIFGLQPGSEQLTGSVFIEGVHPEDRSRVLDAWSEGIREKTGYRVDHRVIQPGGVVRYVREIAEIQLDDAGEPTGFVGTIQDITDALYAAEALEKSESQFRSITENTQDVISIHLRDGTVTYQNPAVRKVLGYDPDVLVGRNIRDFVFTGDLDALDRGLQIAARKQSRGHKLPSPRIRIRRYDGEWRTLEVRVRHLDEVEGQPRILAVSRDVTDQITANEELQRNNRLLELLGNTGIAANFSRSMEEALQLCVDEVCRATGWPVGHAYVREGSDGHQLVPTSIWNKNTSDSFEHFRQVTEMTSFSSGIGLPGRVFSTGQPSWIVDVMVDSNFPRAHSSDNIPVRSAFAFPVLAGDEVVGVLEFFNTSPAQPDHKLLEILAKVGAQLGRVSERRDADQTIRESEARFRNFAEAASDWFWETDADMQYTRFSGRNEEISGISSDKNVGHSRMEILQDILTEDDKADLEKWSEHNAQLARREAFQDFSYSVRRPDGGIIHLRVNGIPIYDDQRQFTGYRGTARDETSEVEARREEAAARAMLLDAIESLDDGFVLFDSDDRMSLCNSRFLYFAEELGLEKPKIGDSFEELATRWAMQGAYDWQTEEIGKNIQDRVKQHRNLPNSAVYKLKNDKWIQVSERRTSDGGSVLVSHQITDLKRIEEALRASDKHMRRLIDIAPEAIIVTDRKMNIQIFNAGAERAFGYNADEIVGKNVEILMPSEYRSEHSKHVREFEKSEVIERPIGARSSIMGLRKNGEIFPAEGAISKLTTLDGPVFTVMLRDITERLAAENELKSARAHLEDAIESISQAVSLWSPEHELILYNQNFRKMFTNFEDAVFVGQTFNNLIDMAADTDMFSSDSAEAQAYGEKRKQSFALADGTPVDRMTPDGGYYQVIDIRTHDGGVLSVGSDVTDVVTRQNVMQEAMQHAELANRAKSEFLANMSHELRTPLNAILGFSEILKTEPFGKLGDRRYIDYVSDIHDSGTHLLEIINDILDLSRIEAGQIVLREEAVDVVEAVERVLTMSRGRAIEGDVNLVADLADDLPDLYADARILRQILVNLISNAVKFTEPDKEVSISAEINSVGEFVICICDEGIGIKEEDLEIVLQPFGQADGSLTRSFEGVGLGLPLTRSFVELHGGDLHLESEVGVGTTVSVAFPANRVMEESGKG
jgi:PAS domain S-box-containing protein